MLTFVLFALAVIGLTNILVHGKILDVLSVRSRTTKLLNWLEQKKWLKKEKRAELAEGAACHECMGFWSGLFCGAVLFWSDPILIPLAGFAASAIMVIYSDLTMYLRSKIEFLVDDGDNDGTTSAEETDVVL